MERSGVYTQYAYWADWHHSDTYTLYSNVEHGRQKIWKEMSCWWVTIIIRMPLSMAASGGKCWSPHCSDTICFANKHCGGCQRGNGVAFKVAHMERRGERCCWVSTCVPKVCPIIPLYSQYTVFPPTFYPGLTHACGEAGFARLAVVSNQL